MANAGLKASEVQGVITARLMELGFSPSLWKISGKGILSLLVNGSIETLPVNAGMGYHELRGVLERVERLGIAARKQRDTRQIDIEDVIRDLQKKQRA